MCFRHVYLFKSSLTAHENTINGSAHEMTIYFIEFFTGENYAIMKMLRN